LNSVSVSEHIQALYRLLLIRTGQRIQAEQALRETLTESLRTIPGDPQKTDFMEFYRTALRMPTPSSEPGKTELAGWALALHHLAEPERSAITLFYLEIFSPLILSEILGLDIEGLALLIAAARKSLERQQPKSATA
jgi:DNA-directed RNA polymerase specialized sigma24 family protein